MMWGRAKVVNKETITSAMGFWFQLHSDLLRMLFIINQVRACSMDWTGIILTILGG